MDTEFDREQAWNRYTHGDDGGAKAAFFRELAAAGRAAREECIVLIQKYIRFDDQQHRHSWHDLQDLLERIRALAASPAARTGG